MSLLSGNTFGAELWSDNKQIAPMFPEISFVQKCPHCGKYYITERQEAKFSTDSYTFEKGILTYPEMKEAFVQLSEEGFANDKEETHVRMMLHHAYNNYYYRTDDYKEINADDKKLFHENGTWLIDNAITDKVMKAEFYREIGEFEAAHDILKLKAIKMVNDEFLKRIIQQVKERLQNNDCRVFKIY